MNKIGYDTIDINGKEIRLGLTGLGYLSTKSNDPDKILIFSDLTKKEISDACSLEKPNKLISKGLKKSCSDLKTNLRNLGLGYNVISDEGKDILEISQVKKEVMNTIGLYERIIGELKNDNV